MSGSERHGSERASSSDSGAVSCSVQGRFAARVSVMAVTTSGKSSISQLLENRDDVGPIEHARCRLVPGGRVREAADARSELPWVLFINPRRKFGPSLRAPAAVENGFVVGVGVVVEDVAGYAGPNGADPRRSWWVPSRLLADATVGVIPPRAKLLISWPDRHRRATTNRLP